MKARPAGKLGWPASRCPAAASETEPALVCLCTAKPIRAPASDGLSFVAGHLAELDALKYPPLTENPTGVLPESYLNHGRSGAASPRRWLSQSAAPGLSGARSGWTRTFPARASR